MARGTPLEGVVEDRIDLGEALGPRGIVGVAEEAELPFLRQGRLDGGIPRVPRRGAVAGLARESLVVPLLPCAHRLVVALRAGSRARVLDLPGRPPPRGGGLLKPHVQELGRQDQEPHHQRPSYQDADYNCEPRQLFGETLTHRHRPPLGDAGSRESWALLPVDLGADSSRLPPCLRHARRVQRLIHADVSGGRVTAGVAGEQALLAPLDPGPMRGARLCKPAQTDPPARYEHDQSAQPPVSARPRPRALAPAPLNLHSTSPCE